MSDPDDPNLIELYQTVLASVKEAGVTDEEQAEELADVVSVGVLEELKPLVAGQPAGNAAPGDGVEKLEQIAEELREERERLEWAAIQVAHLADRARSPSIDPDPTPPDSSPPLLDPLANESVGAPAPDAQAPADGAADDPTRLSLDVAAAGSPEPDGQHRDPKEYSVAEPVPVETEPAPSDAYDEFAIVADVADGHAPRRRRLLLFLLLCLVLGVAVIVWRTGFVA